MSERDHDSWSQKRFRRESTSPSRKRVRISKSRFHAYLAVKEARRNFAFGALTARLRHPDVELTMEERIVAADIIDGMLRRKRGDRYDLQEEARKKAKTAFHARTLLAEGHKKSSVHFEVARTEGISEREVQRRVSAARKDPLVKSELSRLEMADAISRVESSWGDSNTEDRLQVLEAYRQVLLDLEKRY